MTKYYRVRTQEQWEWLKNKLEIEDDLQVSIFPVTILYNDVFCGIYKYHDDPEPLIKVSQMMKESKMEDYVTIKSGDLDKIKFDRPQEDGNSFVVKKVDIMGYDAGKYVRDVELPVDLHIPKSLLYPKVRMSVAEKKEFDELKNYSPLLSVVMERVDTSGNKYQHLYSKLFNQETTKEDVQAQNEFARAWADESLIEVVEPAKFYVKVPQTENDYYIKESGELTTITGKINSREKFTTEELEHHGLEDETIYKREEVKA